MLARDITVVDELGLHIRPAARIASNAVNAKSGVWITEGDQTVSARSTIAILSLGCRKGAVITVAVDDPSDEDVLESILSIIAIG